MSSVRNFVKIVKSNLNYFKLLVGQTDGQAVYNVFSFTPRPLYPQGKSPWYPLDRRLGGPQSSSGHGGEEKNSQPQPGIEP
jgi:hypothetical protein